MRRLSGTLLFLGGLAISIHAQGTAPGAQAPRLADGTPNLGRAGTEKGGLPGVLNFVQMAVGGPAKPNPRLSGPDTGGAPKEPWIPFRPWSAAVCAFFSERRVVPKAGSGTTPACCRFDASRI